jgi:hypothetical protein
MASVVDQSAYGDRRVGERRRFASQLLLRAGEGMRVSWGGVWGGVLVAMGLLMLLAALGVAVGITAADPQTTDARTLGAGAGIWTGVSLLLALFVGGMVSTRIGAIFDSTTGFFEGVLVWVMSVVLMAYLASTGIGTVASGAFKLLGGAGQALGAVVQGGNVDLSSGSVDQIMQRLKDPRTASTLASATGMPQADVEQSLNGMAQKVEASRNDPAQAANAVKQGVSDLFAKAKSEGRLAQRAEEVKPQATKAAWITFGALLLSLLAAVIGAMLGRRTPGVVAR